MTRTFLNRAIVTALLLIAARPALAQPRDEGLPLPVKTETKPGEGTIAPRRTAEGTLVFYRRVSSWEMRKIQAKGGLFVTPGSGESFVSSSREYVDQLGARHPKDYENLMVIEVSAEAMKELEKIGLRASGPLLEKLYPNMKVMEKDRPDAVHFKAELGALNLGLRTASIEVFNKYVKSIKVQADAKLTIPPGERSIKERVRRSFEDEKTKPTASKTVEKTTGMADLLKRRMAEARSKEKTKIGR